MKLIIAGGREYYFTPADYAWLDDLHSEMPVTQVVSGKARGADTCGEVWAERNQIHVEPFPADWDKYGPKAAGPIRNSEMANYADAVALFPGGSGTADMKRKAQKRGLKIYERTS